MAETYHDSLTSETLLLGSSIAGDSIHHSHDYEELPTNTNSYSYADMSGDAVAPPMLMKLTSCNSNNSDRFHQQQPHQQQQNHQNHHQERQPFYRKRDNPLYEGDEKKTEEAKSSSDCSKCTCVLLLLLTVLAATAFVMVVMVISGKLIPRGSDDPRYAQLISPVNSSQLLTALARLEDLERKYSALQNKHGSLQAKFDDMSEDYSKMSETMQRQQLNVSELVERQQQLSVEVANIGTKTGSDYDRMAGTLQQQQLKMDRLSTNGSGYQQQITDLTHSRDQHGDQLNQLERSSSNTIDDLEKVKTNLSHQSSSLATNDGRISVLNNQLIRAVAYHQQFNQSLSYLNQHMPDLSACQTKRRTGTSSYVPSASTKHDPDDPNWVIIGATCSAENALGSSLKQDNNKHYYCECTGVIENAQSITCIMFVWQCPRL